MNGNRKMRIFRGMLLLVVILCLIFLGQAYYHSYRQRQQQRALEELREISGPAAAGTQDGSSLPEVAGPQDGIVPPETSRAPGETNPLPEGELSNAPPPVLEKYRALYQENGDLVGWLSIEGTDIDYPVMQREDDEYYLHHDFYGEESRYGCLYVKGQADVDTPGTNFIIYGHNMKDGSMFGDLDLYRKESFWREHPRISFDTLYEERTYEIIAVFRSRVYQPEEDVFKYYQFYQADNQE